MYVVHSSGSITKIAQLYVRVVASDKEVSSGIIIVVLHCGCHSIGLARAGNVTVLRIFPILSARQHSDSGRQV